MMKKIIVDGFNINEYGVKKPVRVNVDLWNRAVSDIAKNNTWCPDITRIIYNVGEKKIKKIGGVVKYPVLNCTVFFNDGTKVSVTNSANDPIELVKLDNGVVTASERSKECALTYAICKKLIGAPNAKGEVEGNGFGRILRDLVASAWDQKVEEKKAHDQKIVAQAKHTQMQKNAKPKVKRESLAKTVDRLSAAIEKLEKTNGASSDKCCCNKNKSARKRDSRGRFI